ncbi:hypothetical protein [uncultured Desulfovibrio sp.]|uniref:hypothetical protein n=1 Tax=uncultured Desulfovibrio sp. TaxID=167968 RepID=UPI00261F1F89|nr:hypothetical protein [uncultured Desulfovibrio sp.]
MSPFFLPALKARLLADLADFRLEGRGSSPCRQDGGQPRSATGRHPDRSVQIFIGDVPPKKRRPGDAEALDDPFPCVVLIPLSGQADGGEDAVTVALVCGVYCGEEGDAEGAETTLALLLSRIRQSLAPCLKTPLERRYRLTEDAKGRLFPWEKSDMQPHPYIQATVMTHWRMKGLE